MSLKLCALVSPKEWTWVCKFWWDLQEKVSKNNSKTFSYSIVDNLYLREINLV